jgi:hypothetical protein
MNPVMSAMKRDPQQELMLARSAAKAFCTTFHFPVDKLDQLDNPPLFDPISLEREGRPVVAYRWLGGGRGDYYVQVEIDQDDDRATAYGGDSHQEFGPWVF